MKSLKELKRIFALLLALVVLITVIPPNISYHLAAETQREEQESTTQSHESPSEVQESTTQSHESPSEVQEITTQSHESPSEVQESTTPAHESPSSAALESTDPLNESPSPAALESTNPLNESPSSAVQKRTTDTVQPVSFTSDPEAVSGQNFNVYYTPNVDGVTDVTITFPENATFLGYDWTGTNEASSSQNTRGVADSITQGGAESLEAATKEAIEDATGETTKEVTKDATKKETESEAASAEIDEIAMIKSFFGIINISASEISNVGGTSLVTNKGNNTLTLDNSLNQAGTTVTLTFSIAENVTGELNFSLDGKLNGAALVTSTLYGVVAAPASNDKSPITITSFYIGAIETGTPTWQSEPAEYTPVGQGNSTDVTYTKGVNRPNAGDDYASTDEWVRSNDTVVYSLVGAVNRTDANSSDTYKTIIVQIDAVYPTPISGVYYNGMFSSPFTNSALVDDGSGNKINTASTQVVVTTGNSFEVPITLEVYGAEDGTVLQPEFTLSIVSVDGVEYDKDKQQEAVISTGTKDAAPKVFVSSRVNIDVKVHSPGTNGYEYESLFEKTEIISPLDTLGNDKMNGKFVQFNVAVEMAPIPGRSDLKGVMQPTKKIDVTLNTTLDLAPSGTGSNVSKDDIHANPAYGKTVLAAYSYFNNKNTWSTEKFAAVLSGTTIPPMQNSPNVGLVWSSLPGSFGHLSSGAVESTDKKYVHYSGDIKAEDTPWTDVREQQVTLTFKNYKITEHFPTNGYSNASANIKTNIDKYFASMSLLFFVPTTAFDNITDSSGAMLTSKLTANTVYYDSTEMKATGSAGFTLYHYIGDGIDLRTFDRQSLASGKSTYSLTNVLYNSTSDGQGSIAYDDGFRIWSYAPASASASPYFYGGIQLIQKWNPEMVTLTTLNASSYAYSSVSYSATKRMYYYGVVDPEKHPSFNYTNLDAVNALRHNDYIWYANGSGTGKVPSTVNINGTNFPVSAVMVEDFNTVNSGAIGQMISDYKAVPAVGSYYPSTESANINTAAFLSHVIFFREERKILDYTTNGDGILTIANDPFAGDWSNWYNGGWTAAAVDALTGRSYRDLYAIVSLAEGSYSKTVYNPDGTFKTAHNPTAKFGDTVLIVPYSTSITAAISNTVSATDSSAKTSFFVNETIGWKLTPKFTVNTDSGSGIGDAIVTITTKIPHGLSYKDNSTRNIGEPTLGTYYDIKTKTTGTTLTWTINTKPNSTLDEIEFETTIDSDIFSGSGGNTTSRTVSALISTQYDTVAGKSTRTGTATATINRLGELIVSKTVNKKLVDVNESFTYTLRAYSNADTAQSGVGVLDVLPANNDSKSSIVDGTYKVSMSVGSGDIGAKLYYTTTADREALRKTDPNDITKAINNDAAGDWILYTSGEVKDVVAIFVLYDGGMNKDVTTPEINVTLSPKDNAPANRYFNQVRCNALTLESELYSATVRTDVVARSISGIAWEDVNRDGIQNDGSSVLAGIPVVLFKYDGSSYIQVLTNVTGASLKGKETDAKGAYSFDKLAAGTYYVGFDINTSDYIITDYHANGSEDKDNSDIYASETEIGDVFYYLTDSYTFADATAMTSETDYRENVDAGAYLQPKPSTLYLYKTNFLTKEPISEAGFNIYVSDKEFTVDELKDLDALAKVNPNIVYTDSTGMLQYSLAGNKHYLIYEAETPDGYNANTAYFTVYVDWDGSITFKSLKSGNVTANTQNQQATVTNDPYAVFQIAKVDANDFDSSSIKGDSSFDGTEFTVTLNNEIVKTLTVKDGITDYVTLIPNATYYVKETKVVNGYDSSKPYNFFVKADTSGNITVSLTSDTSSNYGTATVISKDAGSVVSVIAAANTKQESLIITKKLEGNDANYNDVFSFEVYLTDNYGVILEGSYPYTKSDGTSGTLTLIDGKYSFTLKGSETFTIESLPKSANYRVTETDSKDYQVNRPVFDGKIAEDGSTIEFINCKNTGSSPSPSPSGDDERPSPSTSPSASSSPSSSTSPNTSSSPSSSTPGDSPSTSPSDSPSTSPSDSPSTSPSDSPSEEPSDKPENTPTPSIPPEYDTNEQMPLGEKNSNNAGLTAIQSSSNPNEYLILDEDGTPIGTITVPEGTDIGEIDILDNLIPLVNTPQYEDSNPKTGDDIAAKVSVLIVAAGALALMLYNKKKQLA